MLIERLALAAGVALGLSVIGTLIMIRIAHRFGWVAKPRGDRWHKKPTALAGGVAIFVGFLVPVLLFLPLEQPQHFAILLGAGLMFAVGGLDDVLSIKPYTKLLAQVVAAAIMIMFSVRVMGILNPWIAIPVTIVWFVGITNAFNLLDNMDGLSSGIACIASAFVVGVSVASGNQEIALLAAAMLGACAGFLVFNFHPAKIFMGDSGSLFIGFTLASCALVGTWEHASNLFLVLAVPVLVLAVPIFDTTLVTITRRLRGQSIAEGGKDHSSHRLVALGLSEPRAVILLWLVAGLFGAVALTGVYLEMLGSVVLGSLALLVLAFFGFYLGSEKIYQAVDASDTRTKPGTSGVLMRATLRYKQRISGVLLDSALITLALLGAYLLRFEGSTAHLEAQIGLFLPMALALKLSVFFFAGIHRLVWRYVSIHDMIRIAKAVAISSALLVTLVLMTTRFRGVSRTVFILDFLLTLILVGGMRVLFRVFRESLELSSARDLPRTVIIGAGDAGEILLRELRQNRDLEYNVVGFVDDDATKRGASIHGVPVLGSREELSTIVTQRQVEHALIAMPRAPQVARDYYRSRLKDLGLSCKEVRVKSSAPSVLAFDGGEEDG